MKSCLNILQFQLKKVILHSKDDADMSLFGGISVYRKDMNVSLKQ